MEKGVISTIFLLNRIKNKERENKANLYYINNVEIKTLLFQQNLFGSTIFFYLNIVQNEFLSGKNLYRNISFT